MNNNLSFNKNNEVTNNVCFLYSEISNLNHLLQLPKNLSIHALPFYQIEE